MKKLIYMAVVAIVALSSCASDNDPVIDETGKQTLTFTATIEGDATRATYNSAEKCASWEVSDQISINGKTYIAQSAGLTTTFKAATTGQEATGSTYNAYFPATLYNNGNPTLPAEITETWADGKFNMPMYATSTTTDLAFKNLCGVLKITVKSDEIAAVKRIKVSSKDKAVSGAFTVTSDAAVLTSPSTIANTLTVIYTDAVSTTAEDKVFYVAVPAQTYLELKIELDANGSGFTKSMTTKSATDITVARNKIYPITFADNYHEYVEISADYDNKPSTPDTSLKWAKMNVGATAENNWGDYFAWGETTPRYTSYTRSGDAITNFDWKTGYGSGYVSPYATYSGTTLDAAHDAATANWGGTWRTPTLAEFQAMKNVTTWTWNDTDKGYYVTRQGVALANDKSNALLFFPAAGYLFGKSFSGNSLGSYWSSTQKSSGIAYYLYISNTEHSPSYDADCYYGHTVRPVSN